MSAGVKKTFSGIHLLSEEWMATRPEVPLKKKLFAERKGNVSHSIMEIEGFETTSLYFDIPHVHGDRATIGSAPGIRVTKVLEKRLFHPESSVISWLHR
ncbi:MAG: hypothetical protein ACLRS8_18275 [Parabacteroides merdae]